MFYKWRKLNWGLVCFEGKGTKPGIFKPRSEGFLAAVKLVHWSGKIVCASRAGHESNWGCHNFPNIVNTPLNVFITDESNHILFPKAGATFTTGVHRNGKWFSIPGFDSRSEYLVLQHGFNVPLYVSPTSILKLWYGEDLLNYAESDNSGRVCASVYGYFV
ncbi:uncharacterized protein LOC116286624 [Actinia tenebrosa]|uniref:Uncharacterized protein LOC116286624 n=1 Tax=Actinia tenebrosa TaxID=6105 RepID=A0A6P8H0Y3_ACTTE|nr:uncharacterized protein LOC116286624 [Actinia tenebrosa]